MPATFVIRNQEGQYYTKKGEWVSGKDSAGLFHRAYHDQTLNQLIELNAKDIYLRGSVVELELCEKRRPIVVAYGPDSQQADMLKNDDIEVDAAGPEIDVGGDVVESTEKAHTGFIRPLNVEPRMPKKDSKVAS